MKRIILSIGIASITVLVVSWGTFGHEHINKAAVLSLPQPLLSFFYNHIDYVTQESTVPDLRKYTLSDKSENPRHFIDLENFGSKDSLPKTLAEAKSKYDEKFLSQNGILPWYMEELMEKLTKSFNEKRKTEILFIAADLGHYMGDAHMPLHTSANYDGLQTNQKGIHSLWESQLAELFGEKYNLYSGEANYIDNIHNEIWKIIFSSHQLKDTVLAVDAALRKNFREEKMYKRDAEGKAIKNKFNTSIFSEEYATQLHSALKGMVEKQMKASAINVSNFWYTAWVNAGKPDMNELDAPDFTKRNNVHLQEELKLFKQGKLFGIQTEKEY